MTLERPEFLWALLLLPLMWWLSRPPAPKTAVLTAHLPQWQLAMHALRRRPPRGAWLRFLLLAAALLAACLAAAGARTPAKPGPDRLVVMLDASSSMAARRDGVSSFAAAQQLVRARLATVPEHVEVTLLRCGGSLRRRYGAAARALLDLGEPEGELAADLAGLAMSLRDERTEVWVVTDGQAQVRLPPRGALDVLDGRGPNASIVALRVEDEWPLPGLQVEVDVVVHAEPDRDVWVSALGAIEGGALRQPLVWQDSRVVTMTFDVQRLANGGRLEFTVDLAGDVMAADNACAVTLPALPAPRVAVHSGDDAGPFAAVAASALAAEVRGQVVPATAGGEVGLLVVDGGVAEVAAGQVRALTFGARLAADVALQPWLAPAGIDWDREHPLTQGPDLSELRIDRAWRGLLPDGEALLWSETDGEREPLAVLVEGDGVASVHFAFRLEDGNLPLLAAFPQLLRRAFVRSYGRAARVDVDHRPPPAGELDLRYAQRATSRPLADFGSPARGLAAWCLAAGLVALALRSLLR